MAAAYFASGKLGLAFAFLHASACAVWPPTGLALAAVLWLGPELAPALFVGAFLVNVTTAGNAATSVAIALGNTLEAVVAAWLTRRWCGGVDAFEDPKNVFRFALLPALAAPAVSATIGVSSLFLAGYSLGGNFWPIWQTWWMGDVTGCLTAAPAVLLWMKEPRSGPSLGRLYRMTPLLAALGVATWLVFSGAVPQLAFLCVPLTAWAAFRLGSRDTATLILALSLAAAMATSRGSGPFARPDVNASLLLLQSFIATLSVSCLAFSAGAAQEARRLRETEDSLLRQRARTRPLFHSNIIGIATADASGRITDANDVFLEMTGRRREEIESRRLYWRDLLPEEALSRFTRELERQGNGEPSRTWEAELLRPDGRRLPVATGTAPLEGTDGWVSFVLDMTENRAALDQLREKSEELARSNSELSQFAYVASHDLQEPLRKIVAFGDRLAQRLSASLDAEASDWLSRLRRSTLRMSRQIEDLLALARVTSRGRPLERVALDQVVEDVVGDLEAPIRESGARVVIRSLPALDADPAQMRQLFQNLLSNALKFRKPAEPPVVRVWSRPGSPGFVDVFVMDSGVGFDPRHADRLFKPFQRLHSRQQYDGTGMGLAICAKIALRHGAALSARSRPGHGALFTLTFPSPKDPT